ncbi:carbohydrate porin [Anabaena cylindrica FACHB-243]|nr:carbohydrate porin [Anabaena cylindrica FACHB-243]MBY5281383.1 iron uptake porin [Anabaena sp. CCAP 1446/1C]MBY5308417.1 iron uptake porin [Anabaena sp. CCAP 1446/1C]
MVIVGAIATSTFIGNIASAQVVLTDHSSLSESESTTPSNSADHFLDSSSIVNSDPAQIDSTVDESMAQINSVAQFSDIQPTDWAFQALQSLVERYGCIAGYPNGTFRGNRAMTRYEFAAGLNACLERINELITTATTDLVKQEDLSTLQRLQTEFTGELTSLRDRVDTLEARATQLETNQFSTTTKLLGDIRVQTNAYFSGDDRTQTSSQYLAFLGLLTSFTGRDLLVTGLATTNTTFPEIINTNNGNNVGGTREGASEASSAGDLFGDLRIITLGYQFPVGEKLNVDIIAINRYRFSPVFLTQFAPYYVRGLGPVGSFAIAPPMYLIGAGSGMSLSYKLFDSTVLKMSYLANFANDSNLGGLLNGDYVAAGEINYNPNPRLFLQFAYQHGYFSPGNFGFNNGQGFRGNGFVGTALANRFDDAGVLFSDASAVTTNGYLLGGYFALSPKVAIGGWANLIKARLLDKGDADIWNYSFQLAFPDLFKSGNHGGLVVGMEPTLTGLESDVPYAQFKNDTSLHLEAYYVHRISDRISITPSLTWITAPNQDANNNDIVIGGLRTTFSF